MTTEEFNALPLGARRWIEQQQGCASCGKSKDADTLYKNYLLMSKKALFTLRRGAVLYKRENGEGTILYPIHPKDSEEQIKEKLSIALEVYAVAPGRFSDIQEDKIAKILAEEDETEEDETEEDETEEDETEEDETEEDETEEDETQPVKKLYGAAKKAAEAKAAKDNLD